jgi:hypothetical protein
MEFKIKNIPLIRNETLKFYQNLFNYYNQKLWAFENIQINFQHF